MTPLEQLKAARELISVPERWTKGKYARDAFGEFADPRGEAAVCFCAIGAVSRVSGINCRYLGAGDAIDALRQTLIQQGGTRSVYRFNDAHTHKHVLNLFDRTIASLEAQQ